MSLQQAIESARYYRSGETTWKDVVQRNLKVLDAVPAPRELRQDFKHVMEQKKFIPGGRILRNAGIPGGQMSNCFLFDVEDSREGWGELTKKATITLMTGGGVGVDYGKLRSEGAPLSHGRGIASGPIPLIKSINEIGRGVQCGGFRRSALYASLPWNHQDIFKFIHMKDWPKWLREQKAKDMDVAAPGDMTNISVRLDPAFFRAYDCPNDVWHDWAHSVYNETVRQMVKTGEPGFQIDMDDQIYRNACTEIISATESDSCVLGAINLAACMSPEDVAWVAHIGTAFLLAVTEANTNPTPETQRVQKMNRRLGLEIMGVGEWFIRENLPYGHENISPYLQAYKTASDRAAKLFSDQWDLPRPVAVRAVGPTGTISIVAETTSGIEPLLAPAYERRYLTAQGVAVATIIDPVATRYYNSGQDITECAYNIPWDTRIKFQSKVQQYVDNAISSTINLPDNKQDPIVFGDTLLPYLPYLRGITVFPNGSRGLQPITPVDIDYALRKDFIVENTDNACPGGVCAL